MAHVRRLFDSYFLKEQRCLVSYKDHGPFLTRKRSTILERLGESGATHDSQSASRLGSRLGWRENSTGGTTPMPDSARADSAPAKCRKVVSIKSYAATRGRPRTHHTAG